MRYALEVLEYPVAQRPAYHNTIKRSFSGARAKTDRQIELPENVDRWQVLRKIRAASKPLSLSPALLRYLEFMIEHTFDCDWTMGAQPIVFISVQAIAWQLDISERQVNNYERALAHKGLIQWRDAVNRRRYGKR
ncbi:helix-turn-helix domain-containing protein, partial [Roseibium sp. RKSG952]|uniref:helix-turn-helix domain-containing protein n=1 Tax=Roseibium sp. RKSG952 TaxID=2529384 RepID=UPI0013C640AA|nr:hypothetical protein [Roseibium sp. RKSG952]